jgi:hypothetical protein
MRNPTVLKYVRIAVTALSLTACVLLIALWVRSYWWSDNFMLRLPNSRVFIIHSMRAQTAWYFSAGHRFSGNWTTESNTVARETDGITLTPWHRELLRFQLHRRPISFPVWVLVALFGGLATLPWLSQRFSLRTLLIATTLVAVALAAIVYASR